MMSFTPTPSRLDPGRNPPSAKSWTRHCKIIVANNTARSHDDTNTLFFHGQTERRCEIPVFLDLAKGSPSLNDGTGL